MRLDLKEAALSERDGDPIIIPGDSENSLLLHRIFTEDEEDLMPPPEAKLPLSAEKKDLLRQWIAEGAPWEEHWSFIPPRRPDLPKLNDADWIKSPVDAFVLRKLNSQSDLSPEAESNPERLLRRLTLDLTGLPPTLAELDTYLNDASPNRYEKAVDRLLSSEGYAERMALDWMDLSRYADSHGMHADGWRMMWPWRDWVIESFKRNQPYDEFVTWQLAGDLLPDPDDEQIIATAFHRNHAMTAEGGIVDEEFRLQYVFDRAQTTATAFLGLTLECARCHDHKFDPISQRDYYSLTAFFNNLKELGMTGDDGNYGPMHLMASSDQKLQLADLEREITDQRKRLDQILSNAPPPDTANSIAAPQPDEAFPFDEIKMVGEEGKQKKRLDGHEGTSLSGTPEIEAGHRGGAIRFNSEYDIVSLAKVGLYESTDTFSATVWLRPDAGDSPRTIMGNAGAKNNFWRGWDFYLDEDNRVALKLIHALPHSYIHVRTQATIATEEWSQVGLTYDGSSTADGIQLFLNGQNQELEIIYDHLYKTIYPVSGSADRKPEDRALRIGKAYRSFTGEYGIYSGLIDEIRFWNQTLTAAEIADDYNASRNPDHDRVALTSKQVAQHRVRRENQDYRKTRNSLTALYRQRLELVNGIPEIMVMEELSPPRETFVLRRGQYDAQTDPVSADTPSAILPFAKDLPRNRLGLAQWLFHENNPLTARVTVNRYWQLFFGKGLVETSEDFGKQGAQPTHPELLDWLAVEFRNSGWDLKHLCKLIVTSATYRQSSDASVEKRTLDPRNDLLARGPRHRLQAELIRDQALAASGLLVPTVGGPSVKPFQPEGLWIDKGNFSAKLLHYKPDTGDKLYRRSLYTFIRRTSPHPAMVAFDAPNRDVCQVRRERTNTPLQALVLMNDPQFVEAARVFAERIQHEAGPDPHDQIRYAFRTVTSRYPSNAEQSILSELIEHEVARFSAEPESAKAILETGDQPADPDLDPISTASLAMLANTLLNHDEFYTKR